MFHATSGVENYRPAWSHIALTMVLILTGGKAAAQAPVPFIADNLFIMPVVQVFDTPYRIEWQIIETPAYIDLLLHDYEQLLDAELMGAPSFYGELLNVPHVVFNGLSFWGEFYQNSEQPVIFRLKAAEVNNPGGSGIEGKWRIIEEVDDSDCGGGEVIEIYNLSVIEVNNQLQVRSPAGTFPADLDGTSLQWSGSYAQDGGTANTQVEVQLADSLNNLIGVSQWTRSNNASSCDGVSVFTGELLHN